MDGIKGAQTSNREITGPIENVWPYLDHWNDVQQLVATPTDINGL